MPSALDIEKALTDAWPSLETVTDGRWEARFANGYSGRSNSIQTLDAADDADALARIEALAPLYRARGLVPAFKITPMTGPGVVSALDALGWRVWHESIVMTMPLSGRWARDAAVTAFDPALPEWLAHQDGLKSLSETDRQTLGALFGRLGPAAGLTLAGPDGTPAAAALAVKSGDFCAAFNVVTHRAMRRQGLGRRIMESVLAWGHGAGASFAAIQVQADNAAAIALYQGLGFVEAYPYHYRLAGEIA